MNNINESFQIICSKCGTSNNANTKYCFKCGFENISNGNFSSSVNQGNSNKKKNKTIIVIFSILLILVLLIFILMLIFKKSDKFNDPFKNVEDLVKTYEGYSNFIGEEVNFGGYMLSQEFKENNITADEYIMQLAYSIYEPNKLDYKYKDLEFGISDPGELFDKMIELANSLSDDTLKYVFGKYTLSDVVWDVELENGSLGMKNQITSDSNLMPLVSDDRDLSKLDKVILSPKENFLIYYTTSGINAITDDEAKAIAKNMEEFVSSYEEKYGLKFKYNPRFSENFFSTITEVISFELISKPTTKARKLLEKSKIDAGHLETAMPVFVIDTDYEKTGALGYYVPPHNLGMELTVRILNIFMNDPSVDNYFTTYALPYFAVSSSLDDMNDFKLIAAHELFHHYQKYICGDGQYVNFCESGSFTEETTANFVSVESVNVDSGIDGTQMNLAAANYIYNVSTSIDKVDLKKDNLGYPAFVFAKNYADIVEDGYKYLFQSIKYKETLKYLYDSSGGNYYKVMLLMAERNLTLDYDNKQYLAKIDGVVYYPLNHMDLTKLDSVADMKVDYSSMQYFYVNPNKFVKEDTQIIFDSNSKDLSLLLFIKENDKYNYLYTHALKDEFVININDFDVYDEIVFCVVNSSIVDNIDYNIEVEEDGNRVPTVTFESLQLVDDEEKIKNQSSFECYQIEENEDWFNISQLRIGFDKNSRLNEMYFKGTYKIKDYDDNDVAFDIAKRIVSGMLHVMEKSYKSLFKHVDTIITEEEDEYSVTFKIKKNYYDALKGTFDITSQDKLEIIESIRSSGFSCSSV